MTFSEKLTKFKEKTKMTNREIASLIGVPLRTFEDWKAGNRVPDNFKRRIIEEILAQNETIIIDDK